MSAPRIQPLVSVSPLNDIDNLLPSLKNVCYITFEGYGRIKSSQGLETKFKALFGMADFFYESWLFFGVVPFLNLGCTI